MFIKLTAMRIPNSVEYLEPVVSIQMTNTFVNIPTEPKPITHLRNAYDQKSLMNAWINDVVEHRRMAKTRLFFRPNLSDSIPYVTLPKNWPTMNIIEMKVVLVTSG